MQFFALIGVRASDSAPPADLLRQEGAQAIAEYGSGFLRQIWTRGDEPGTAAIVEAESAEEARRRLDAFPLSRAGLTTIDRLVPLEPFRRFTAPR